MNATTAAIDLAKNVFQVVLADANARVLEQHRLTRPQFERFFDNRHQQPDPLTEPLRGNGIVSRRRAACPAASRWPHLVEPDPR